MQLEDSEEGKMMSSSDFNQFKFILKFFLSFAPEVSDQPLRGECVLRRHPPPHHGVQEGLPLPRVETQHLLMESVSEAGTTCTGSTLQRLSVQIYWIC